MIAYARKFESWIVLHGFAARCAESLRLSGNLEFS